MLTGMDGVTGGLMTKVPSISACTDNKDRRGMTRVKADQHLVHSIIRVSVGWNQKKGPDRVAPPVVYTIRVVGKIDNCNLLFSTGLLNLHPVVENCQVS